MSSKKNIALTLSMLVVMSFVTIGLMLFDTVSVSAVNDRNKSIYELESELSGLKKEETALKAEINKSKAQAASYAGELRNLDSEISLLTAQTTVIDELLADWQEVSNETKAQIETLEQQKSAELGAFDSMLRMSYQHGTDTYFNLIFGSEDIGDFLSRTDLLAYHFEANDNVLTNLNSTITELEDANAQYASSLAKLEEFGKEQEELKKQLEERETYALQKKQEYEQDAAKKQAQLDAKASELKQMEAEIKRRYEENRRNDTSVYSGVFYTPTRNYRISSEFEWRNSPINGRKELHNGIDFAAPAGTPIYAADDGTVIDSRYSSSWGNVIQIDHGGGVVTLYAHCSARLVSNGKTVKKGELIAKVGTTGWSTGNHLHFTVYKAGTAVNPRQYLGSI